jgi:hypothetical protein
MIAFWGIIVEQVPRIAINIVPRCGDGIDAVRDQSSRTIRLIFGGLIAVLVFLPAFALWGAFSAFQAGAQAKHASGLANAFEEARFAVGA